MSKAPFFFLLFIIALIVATAWYLHGAHPALLSPAGPVGAAELHLMILVTALSMVIIIPVFILTVYVAWKYREGNRNAKHSPDWDYKASVDAIWWIVPTTLIIIISAIIWISTYRLDPYKPLASSQKPIDVEVVAMDWKWLFIYPEQGIATVNLLEFPAGTPVQFDITSDAPMNSFWIPELGSQIYAMPSMTTELNLMASTTGEYQGVSANISGAGFAGMAFDARSVSEGDFEKWVQSVKASPDPLTIDAYNDLAEPSSNNPPAFYSSVVPSLYNDILAKDMAQANSISTSTGASPMSGMGGMDMGGMKM